MGKGYCNKIKNYIMWQWHGFLSYVSEKTYKWGLDDDNDLTLKAAFCYFTFYKWSNPTLRLICNFAPFDDTNSKNYYYRWVDLIYTNAKLEKDFKCNCGNPEYNFDCTCEHESKNPGEIMWYCEFCGIYKASIPICTKCERDD